MDKIIKKDIVNGVEYKYNGIGGGGSITDNNVIYISQADYDNLTPAEKADATKNYVIIGQGGIPVPTEIDAEDVNFDNTGTSMQSDNVQDAIEEVFQSVSNGKTLIAAAITDKGVSTAASDSFQTMAGNISSLATEPTIITNIKTENPNIASGTIIATSHYNTNNYSSYGRIGDSEFYTIDHNIYIWGQYIRQYNDSKYLCGMVVAIGDDGSIQTVQTEETGTTQYTRNARGYSVGKIQGDDDTIYVYNDDGNKGVCKYILSTKQLIKINLSGGVIPSLPGTIVPYVSPEKPFNLNITTNPRVYGYENFVDYLVS